MPKNANGTHWTLLTPNDSYIKLKAGSVAKVNCAADPAFYFRAVPDNASALTLPQIKKESAVFTTDSG